MILVTGATGHLGKAATEFLLQKTEPKNIAVFARNQEKAANLKSKGIDVRLGDYDDYTSLVNAFKGIEKLYFVSGNDLEKREQQHLNIIKAAKETSVKHVVYTSFQRKKEDASSPIAIVAQCHINTEKWLIASGLSYTILKHALYMDGIPMFTGSNVLEKGIFLPAGNGKVSYALRSEMAEAAANILTSDGHENKIYEFSGTESYSFGEIADIISNISGKKVNYTNPSQEIYKQEMTKAGVPLQAIAVVSAFSEGIKQGEFDFPDNTMKRILGRKLTEIKEFLKEAYSL